MFTEETWIKTNMAPLANGLDLRGFAPHVALTNADLLGALAFNGFRFLVLDAPIDGECFRVLRPSDIVIMVNLGRC